jgi:hypothetical protein
MSRIVCDGESGYNARRPSPSLSNIIDATTTRRCTSNSAHQSEKFLLIGRDLPFWAQNGRDISNLPLHHVTWCVVLNKKTNKSYFWLLCEYQNMSKTRSIVCDDEDWGKGIHPKADKEWVDKLIGRKQWSGDDHKIRDVISRIVNGKKYITVFIEVSNKEKRKDLHDIRRDHGYDSKELVRVPLSSLPSWEKKKARDLLKNICRDHKVLKNSNSCSHVCHLSPTTLHKHATKASSLPRQKTQSHRHTGRKGKTMIKSGWM